MSEFDYSAEKFESIFQKIVKERAGHLKGTPTPAFYLVMGQPGSGKTMLIDEISRSLGNNVLICNADDLRNYHPHFEEIVRDHESDLPKITWPFARDMNRRLIEFGAGRKFNLVVETTGWDRQIVLDTLKEKKEQGYFTYLQVLAIPRAFSWLGIHLRFETMKEDMGFGRMVQAAEHDERYELLRENLPYFVASPHLDHAAVFTRGPLLQQEGRSPLVELASVTAAALPAFFGAIGKKMGLDESRAFFESSSRVVEFMHRRGAPAMDIQLFEEEAQRLGREG
jgi:predicted ABC-type ATPase